MADRDDSIPGNLGTEIAPPSRPRDQGGKYIRETAQPDTMFAPRPVEGNPETGDTSDGGDDPGLRSRERNVRGKNEQNRRAPAEVERSRNESDESRGQRGRHAPADDGRDVDFEEEPENITAESESDTAVEPVDDGADEADEAAEKFPVIIDGEESEVTLKEALAGYIRTQTYHKSMATLQTIQGNMEMDAGKLQQGWQTWHKAVKDYEEDLFGLIPKEPDWDREFAANPVAAHANQKIYQALYKKLADSRAMRSAREAKDAEEADARLRRYAEQGFARFIQMNNKTLRTQDDVDKNIKSMRRTATAAGFTEPEVATVFDPRMLTILLKASKYDRMQAAQVRPENPSRGRTLTPGSATPGNRNAPRKGLDEAARRLQQTGKLDDAADFFSRVLERG